MTKASPDPSRQGGSSGACAHPWLLVTCGECGARIDKLGPASAAGQTGADASRAKRSTAEEPEQALFIVARGHPELVAQLKAVMGDSGPVRVIEDRRRASRGPDGPPEPEAAAVRMELRRRVLGDNPDQKS